MSARAPALVLAAACAAAAAAPRAQEEGRVRYGRARDLDFESLLVEGQVRKPDISVVIGDPGGGDEGLLRLREDFIDQIAMDAGEAP